MRIGFFGLLGLVFIILKLCGVIDWDWWIVLAPIWGSVIIYLVIIILVAVDDYKHPWNRWL